MHLKTSVKVLASREMPILNFGSAFSIELKLEEGASPHPVGRNLSSKFNFDKFYALSRLFSL